MAKEKKKRSRIAGFFLSLLMVALVLLVLAAAFVYVWSQTARPEILVDTPELTVEAGSTFSTDTIAYRLYHATPEQLVIHAERVDTNAIGDYKVTFKLKKSEIEQFVEYFSENPYTEADMTVHVIDTVAPALSVVEDTQVIGVGTTLKVKSLVKEITDATQVKTTFEDGSTEMTFHTVGEYEVKIICKDAGGNEAEGTVTVDVRNADLTPPEIQGAAYTVVKTGEAFDVMAGVTVTDQTDPTPELTVEPESIDTNTPGDYVIKYTSSDALGNTATIERIVTVADNVAQYNGVNFGIFWDNTGIPNQPYLVAVNRAMNVVTVYQQDEAGMYTVPVRVFLCSTGTDTPVGSFRTEERYRWHLLFDDAFGQYATRINGHILFHSVPYFTENPADLEFEEFNKLGTPASLGCIRLCVSDAKWIYENCPSGFPTVIYDNTGSAGPLGTPMGIKIDINDLTKRGWDPTDPDPANPYLSTTSQAESTPVV